jgi:hypothetical protein
VAASGTTLRRIDVGGRASAIDVRATAAGLAAAPGGRRLVLALRAGGVTRVVLAETPTFAPGAALRVLRTIAAGRLTGPVALAWL